MKQLMIIVAMLAGLIFGFHSTGLRASLRAPSEESVRNPRAPHVNLDSGGFLKRSQKSQSDEQKGIDYDGSRLHDQNLPPEIVKAIDSSFDALETSIAGEESHIKVLKKRGRVTDAQLQRLEKTRSIFRALQRTPVHYQDYKVGACGKVFIEGQGSFYPDAVEVEGKVIICPRTQDELQNSQFLVSLLIHEMVHVSDESDPNFAVETMNRSDYECRTDKIALRIVLAGTGEPGVPSTYACD